MTKQFLRTRHSNLAISVKYKKNIRKLRKAPAFPYEMYLEEKKATNDSEKAKLCNQFFQSVFKPNADGSLISGSNSLAGHQFYGTAHCIGSIDSEQEDSFHNPVAGHRFQASGNEKKNLAQDCVAGYRFCSNGLSKIDCTVEQIEELMTKLDVNKAKGPDSIGKIQLKKLAPTLS